jgi:hypothetical protein
LYARKTISSQIASLSKLESICNEADIICLAETHLDQNITNDGIFIEGYCKDPFRKGRNNSGGGVQKLTNL